MKNRFNAYRNPKQFNSYMCSLENNRHELGLSDNYDEINQHLIGEYLSTKVENKKILWRNKIVMYNIKLAHEILYTKLKINILRNDSIDIFQEMNLYLIESVSKLLSKIETGLLQVERFSANLYFTLMSKLGQIVKSYFDFGESIIYEDNLDYLETNVAEDYSDYVYDIKLACNIVLHERERFILDSMCLRERSLYETSFQIGLDEGRTRTIFYKSIKKIRERLTYCNDLNSRQFKFRKKADFLRKFYRKKYVLAMNKDLKYAERLIHSGIHPDDWIILVPEYRGFRFDTLFRVVAVEDVPFDDSVVLDWTNIPISTLGWIKNDNISIRVSDWIANRKLKYRRFTVYREDPVTLHDRILDDMINICLDSFSVAELEGVFDQDRVILEIMCNDSYDEKKKVELMEQHKRSVMVNELFPIALIREQF